MQSGDNGINNSMTIYLYIKTHRVTGMKYFGKTKCDPYKYKGSGKYWKRHISVYGYDCDTEIVRECHTNNEVIEWGKYYSVLWNIVDSHDWANLKPEEGDGGETPGSGERLSKLRKGNPPWNKGIPQTPEMKELNRITHLGKITSEKTKEKQKEANMGRKMSEQARANMRLAQAGKILTEEHKNKIRLARAKQVISPCSDATKKKMHDSAIAKPVLTCPRCGAIGKGGTMYRWHFDQCKQMITA